MTDPETQGCSARRTNRSLLSCRRLSEIADILTKPRKTPRKLSLAQWEQPRHQQNADEQYQQRERNPNFDKVTKAVLTWS